MKRSVENFVRWQFLKKIEKVYNWSFPSHFGATLVLFLYRSRTNLIPPHLKDSDMVWNHYWKFRLYREDSIWDNLKNTKFLGLFEATFG